MLNVKARGADVRHTDPLKAPISSPDDNRINILLQFGDMALNMCAEQGKRIKQLSKDTATAIHQTCYGIVDLCRHLLATSHKYVLLGQFTTDHLEKEFGKLREGCGGTYFINVQQIIEKLHIKQTSLLLSLNIDIDSFDVTSGHECASCTHVLCEEGSEIFDNLETLESSHSDATKMTLLYIAGYVVRNNYDEEKLLEHTAFYYEKFGKYIKSLDRGGLKIPSDTTCQWVFFSFILFHTVKEKVCRKSLSRIFMLVSEFYFFDMAQKHCNTLIYI